MDMLILQKSWISFLIFLSLLFILTFSITKLRRIMPCLYCSINRGLKLYSPSPAPILTCVVLARVSILNLLTHGISILTLTLLTWRIW